MFNSSIKCTTQRNPKQKMLMAFSVIFSTLLTMSFFTTFADAQVLPIDKTVAIPTDEPVTLLVNRTTIPVDQINITVRQFTQPVDEDALKPIGEIGTIREQKELNISAVDTQIILEPTGEATTAIFNRTVIPFNQTEISVTTDVASNLGNNESK